MDYMIVRLMDVTVIMLKNQPQIIVLYVKLCIAINIYMKVLMKYAMSVMLKTY